ncbi:MAG: hypothetical protein OSJ70_05940 [Bacilli bacterium]|nr:hypothetical protein [Bacilli bacterium]
MYCRKCKSLLQEDSHICPKCGTDNDATMDLSDVVYKLNLKKKKQRPVTVAILFLFLTVGIISLYLIKDSKAILENEKITIPNTTQAIQDIKKLKYEDITLEYPGTFGKTASTIFYKTNANIYINISIIDASEYNNLINGNECLDSLLGNINTKTFAEENSYNHLFMLNNKYYNITVHYPNDDKIYTEAIQLNISKILNSIKEK